MSADLWAGAEVQVATVASYLVGRPDLSLIAVLLNEGRLARELRRLGVQVTVVDENQNSALRILAFLTRFLRENNVEVVHTHRYKDSVLGTIAAKLVGVPHVIRTVHGLSEPMRGWDRAKFRAYEALDKATLWCFADLIIAVSKRMAETLRDSGYRATMVTHIHNGIDLRKVRAMRSPEEVRGELGLNSQTLLIGTAGRLSPVKGHAGLLRAARLIFEKERRARLLIVGGGPLAAELRASAARLQIDDKCLFVGPRADVYDLMSAMDVFVLPSLDEGIPMAILEAMALGVPVVATAVGGVPEVVQHRMTGLLVAPRDEQALADACLELGFNRDWVRTLCVRARQVVEEEFSHERNGLALLDIYRRVAGAAKVKHANRTGRRTARPLPHAQRVPTHVGRQDSPREGAGRGGCGAATEQTSTEPVMLPTTEHLAVVLGMFETGLAVGRSLGRAGIRVFGLESCKKVGFCSKYIQASICPHPLEQEEEFVKYLLEISSGQKLKPVLFVTSDDFLMAVSRNRGRLQDFYLMNMPSRELFDTITDKLKQYELAVGVAIPVPKTWGAGDPKQLLEIQDEIALPAFVKGRELNSWRGLVGTNRKGFLAQTKEELIAICRRLFEIGAVGLIQEVIPGPDTNHFKASCYISQKGEVLLAFGLQKIRQKPAGFGYGCVVQSVHYPELLELGKRFLTSIGYRGVGSVEFKLDQRTGRLNLIELNPRYWQQNALAERCGMNFPVINYLDLIGSAPAPVVEYAEGIKWVNIYDDVESFQSYRRKGELSTREWLRSLRGPKVFSDFALDDVRPFVCEGGYRRMIAGPLTFAMKRVRKAVWRTGTEASAGPSAVVRKRRIAASGDR